MAAKLGSGARFEAIKESAGGGEKGAAIAAVAGRKAHGQAAMTRYSKMGKRRAARSGGRSGGR